MVLRGLVNSVCRRLRTFGISALVLPMLALAAVTPCTAGGLSAFTDAQLIDGFNRTVFGLEFGSARFGREVKKYAGPVRLKIIDLSGARRTAEVARFVGTLPGLIKGLDIRVVGEGAKANFTVYVVNRDSYVATVKAGVLGTHAGAAPGQCLVRVDPGANGIVSSTAVIVSDEGDGLFRRCMTEEILQGLGPMNDDSRLTYSMFNDSSTYERMTSFDRAIVSMLYDRRIRFGMDRDLVTAILPDVVADLRRRLR